MRKKLLLFYLYIFPFISYSTQIGPDNIIKCPFCETYYKYKTYISVYMINTLIWTDQFKISEGLSYNEIPKIIKCNNCKNYFWINESKDIGSIERTIIFDFYEKYDLSNDFSNFDQIKKKIKNNYKYKDKLDLILIWFKAKYLKNNLETDDFLKLANFESQKNLKKELFYRINALWKKNDEIRYNKIDNKIVFSYNKNDIDNMYKIINLLDDSEEHKLLKIEIFRELGDFNNCEKYLFTPIKKENIFVINLLIELIKNKDIYVKEIIFN